MANISAKICVRRDTAANWTSNNPTLAVGEMCYETNTGKFKVGTGTVWTSTSYGNSSFLASGASAITRTVDAKLLDTVSVKDYGATGNGSTNDTTAIQAALDANAGKCVYFPQGTYRTTTRLLVAANTTLKGDDQKAVIDVQPANPPTANGDPGPLTYNNGFELNGDGVIIDGLWIRGSNEAKYREGNLTRRDEYASGIKATDKNNVVIKNCTVEKFGNGIYFTGGDNYKITDNLFFGGRQMGCANQIANTHDIWMNGSNASTSNNKGLRGIISRNHCLSNNDSAIAVGIDGGDADVIISENVCEPFHTDGIQSLINIASATPLVDVALGDSVLNNEFLNKTRYGIVVSYSAGGFLSRMIVSNNIVRNYAMMGIYANAGVVDPLVAGSEVVITGNLVDSTGFGLLYPQGSGLKSGIWVNCNGGKTVSGNLIKDCAGLGIQVNGAAGDTSNVFATPVVTGNTILRTVRDPIITNTAVTSGSGIGLFGSTVHSVLVTSNRIFNSAGNGIQADCTSTAGGNLKIDSNLISHNNLLGGILIAVVANGKDCFVSNNSITGTNAVDANSGKNAGINFTGRVHCTGNIITTFNRGIQSNLTARTTDLICANNSLNNMVFGICGNAEIGPWLVSDNAFTSITNNLCHAGPYQGTMLRQAQVGPSKVDIIQVTATAPPATGTWEVGDYVKNSTPAVGKPKGWYCTVRATHPSLATWVSEENLLTISEYQGTAIPTVGTFAVGDRVWNSTPAVGSPKSWVCTVAGTQGTWVSEGELESPLTVTQLNNLAAGVKVKGARGFCTDATVTTFASTVVSGGANNVPVYHDGTAWKIG
jgi:hypothetical protein